MLQMVQLQLQACSTTYDHLPGHVIYALNFAMLNTTLEAPFPYGFRHSHIIKKKKKENTEASVRDA